MLLTNLKIGFSYSFETDLGSWRGKRKTTIKILSKFDDYHNWDSDGDKISEKHFINKAFEGSKLILLVTQERDLIDTEKKYGIAELKEQEILDKINNDLKLLPKHRKYKIL